MTPQVFISHSSKDKAVADVICHQLESAEIPCWMAPRNIEYGSDWTEGIMRGITACRVFVLVFSENANGSGHVRREVAKAFYLGWRKSRSFWQRPIQATLIGRRLSGT